MASMDRYSYFKMPTGAGNLLSRIETTCGGLLYELQIIWDEVGESDAERDRMLLELEQECLEVYTRKVDQANRYRVQLRQAIADAEAELADICSAMGERPVHIRQSDKNCGSLKAELRAILPQIEEMRNRRIDRKNQFIKVLEEIHSIKTEIYRSDGFALNGPAVDEADLSLKKLEELYREMQALQSEKSERLKLVLDRMKYLDSLCIVLGLDFKKIVSEIHPSLAEAAGSKNISNSTIEQLGTAIQNLRELKIQRMQQLQDLTTSLLELWDLMDTPIEEQQTFQKVTCHLAASEDEMTEPDILSLNYINYVKAEVSRLEELKESKMKELILKKKAELEVICRKTHLIPDSDSAMEIAIDAIDSGAVDATYVLEQIELQIARVKEETLCRKEILEKVEKWMAACDEESWLEEYNRDDNRYNAGRGAHVILKRAEKARALVNKLPAMVGALASKVIVWENEKGIAFTYDGVRLLSMLEQYMVLRQEKEQERKRQRDQKKLQGQLLTEQEAIYGSKPSPVKNQSVKKRPRSSCGGATNRALSLGGPTLQTPKREMPPSAKATPNTRNAKKNESINKYRLKDDGLAAPSSGRRVVGMAGLPAKQQSPNLVNARQRELSVVRKPFSPISFTNSSKTNATNTLEDRNKRHNKTLHKTPTTNNKPFTTPPKTISIAEQENRTPQTTGISVPSTPSTASLPVQTPTTPSPVQTTTTPVLSTKQTVHEEIEYSFEERRAGFVLPRSRLMSVTQI
ncbi:microtubule-associated protein 3 [Sesamum alatum]|uniref:Microtubule-associated protein 3 n=1 Tax=Sesamum alatum TaxID=300844 RepID=A0AAE2CVU0_9LAMI|nr:microtubule-associated protein 3 [Sesamum alatum]